MERDIATAFVADVPSWEEQLAVFIFFSKLL